MIVLDTNIISELMRSQPETLVLNWVSVQPRTTLYTTSINRAEILFGIAALPEGGRRAALSEAAAAMFNEDFAGRVLPFDAAAASHYAQIVIGRRRAGAPIEAFDALIAATALMAGATVATRDIGGFEGCGLTLINPWDAQ
jgi:predicted nucleic acid-binding protein